MSCFPISIQATSFNEDYQPEISLVAEVAETILDFTSGLLRKIKTNSPHTLTELQKLSLVQNPETPAEVLNLLSTDSSNLVRNALVTNPSAPASALLNLARDNDLFIKAQAKAILSMVA